MFRKLFSFLPLAAAATAPLGPRVQILSEQPLPASLNRALDIRWANEQAVYLARIKEGTVQASIQPLGGQVREVIPGAAKNGGFWASYRLGASAKYVVAAAPFGSLTWQPVSGGPRKELGLDVMDLDVHQDRLVVLGARRDSQGRWAPDGAIAWLGSLDQGLRDLKPILFDNRGPGAPNLAACGSFEVGGVRFLEDGSFLVLPGVQPGAYLYDPSGKLLRTWDTGTLGIDTDCSTLTTEQARLLQEPGARKVWLDQRRILDDIVPLPEGPALLVKSVSGQQARWEMKILRRQGGFSTLPLPITYTGFRGTLHADVRGDRIVFLKTGFGTDGFLTNSSLILAKVNRD